MKKALVVLALALSGCGYTISRNRAVAPDPEIVFKAICGGQGFAPIGGMPWVDSYLNGYPSFSSTDRATLLFKAVLRCQETQQRAVEAAAREAAKPKPAPSPEPSPTPSPNG